MISGLVPPKFDALRFIRFDGLPHQVGSTGKDAHRGDHGTEEAPSLEGGPVTASDEVGGGGVVGPIARLDRGSPQGDDQHGLVHPREGR